MSSRLRIILAVVGIILILLSIAALVYVVWPLEEGSDQIPLPPELFRQMEATFDWLSGLV